MKHEYKKEAMEEIISEGKPITYKSLCDRTGLRYLKGDSKVSQLNYLNDYVVELSKQGTKLHFVRYRTPQEINDTQLKGLFHQVVEAALSNALCHEPDYSKTYTATELLLACNMISEDYKVCCYDEYLAYTTIGLDYDETLDAPLTQMNMFRNSTKYIKMTLTSYLIGALNSLCNKSLILKYDTYRTFRVNKDGFIVDATDVKIGEKDNPTLSIILECEAEARKQLGFETKKDISGYRDDDGKYIRRPEKYMAAYREICNELFTRKTKHSGEWDGFYPCYLIVFNNSGLRSNLEDLKKEANKLSIDKIKSLKSFSKCNTEFLDIMLKAIVNEERPYKLIEARREYYRKLRLIKESNSDECRDL